MVIHNKSSIADRQRFDADPDLDLDIFFSKKGQFNKLNFNGPWVRYVTGLPQYFQVF
jgi:hypothetical protein